MSYISDVQHQDINSIIYNNYIKIAKALTYHEKMFEFIDEHNY